MLLNFCRTNIFLFLFTLKDPQTVIPLPVCFPLYSDVLFHHLVFILLFIPSAVPWTVFALYEWLPFTDMHVCEILLGISLTKPFAPHLLYYKSYIYKEAVCVQILTLVLCFFFFLLEQVVSSGSEPSYQLSRLALLHRLLEPRLLPSAWYLLRRATV